MSARKLRLFASLVVAVSISGCAGVKFKDEAVDLRLPDDWKYRTPVKNTADLRFFMKENVGLLVTEGPSPDTYQVLAQPILPSGFQPREETIKDGTVYSSKITHDASSQGGYLAFSTSLSANQAVDYTIVDISRVDVPWNQMPDSQIRSAAAAPNPNHLKRLWIQSLILSRVISQSYSEIKCDASGSLTAFQASGKCFSSTGTTSNDYAIGAVFVDVDKYVQNNPVALAPATKNMLFELHSMVRQSMVYNEPSLSGGGSPEITPRTPEGESANSKNWLC